MKDSVEVGGVYFVLHGVVEDLVQVVSIQKELCSIRKDIIQKEKCFVVRCLSSTRIRTRLDERTFTFHPEHSDFEQIKRVHSEDLPLYVFMTYKSELFAQILKRGFI